MINSQTHQAFGVRKPYTSYNHSVGPYTVDVYNGFVLVYRHAWRDKCGGYDNDRNVREVRFPKDPGRLPQ